MAHGASHLRVITALGSSTVRMSRRYTVRSPSEDACDPRCSSLSETVPLCLGSLRSLLPGRSAMALVVPVRLVCSGWVCACQSLVTVPLCCPYRHSDDGGSTDSLVADAGAVTHAGLG